MALDGVSLAETIDRASESVEQDQIARMCMLILIYTLRKLSPWSQHAEGGDDPNPKLILGVTTFSMKDCLASLAHRTDKCNDFSL